VADLTGLQARFKHVKSTRSLFKTLRIIDERPREIFPVWRLKRRAIVGNYNLLPSF
jgi:hypothetical protein